MKKLSILAALVLVPAAHAADVYDIDPGHTFPSFAVDHLGFSTHTGRFNETSGSFTIDRKGAGSSVKVTIKTASVDTGGDKLDKHLRSADFFDVEKYPEMIYESTKVTWTSDTTADVEGNLTLRGVTRAVPLKITRARCDTHPMKKTWYCGFAAETSIKRSDFGMTYIVPAVGDEVRISIQAEGTRREGAAGPKK